MTNNDALQLLISSWANAWITGHAPLATLWTVLYAAKTTTHASFLWQLALSSPY